MLRRFRIVNRRASKGNQKEAVYRSWPNPGTEAEEKQYIYIYMYMYMYVYIYTVCWFAIGNFIVGSLNNCKNLNASLVEAC